MRDRGQRICALMGPLGIVLFFVGMYPLARFLPPLQPSLDAPAVAAVYRENAFGIRFGAMIMMVAATMLLAFTVTVSIQLWRIGRRARAMAVCQIAASAVEAVFIVLPVAIWCVASLRLNRSPELIQLASDLGWILLVMPAPPAMLQVAAVGFGILSDDRADPVLPRWLGYYSLWTAILYAPGLLIPMFLTGPFAWNGLIAFWLVAVVFGLWFMVMSRPLLRAIRSEEAEGAQG